MRPYKDRKDIECVKLFFDLHWITKPWVNIIAFKCGATKGTFDTVSTTVSHIVTDIKVSKENLW